MPTTYNFPPTSRYYGIELVTLTLADGEQRIYLRRRFLPPSARFALLHTHLVTDGERLDRLTAQELGDPQAFWRIADANDAMRPDELTELVGRRLRITLPEGIPGGTPIV
jgi:hypothetical protein